MARQTLDTSEHARRLAYARWQGPREKEKRVRKLEAHIKRIVDETPPLTDEQRNRLIALLTSGRRSA